MRFLFDIIRTVLTFGCFVPGILIGTVVGILSWSRRNAMNILVPMVGDLAIWISGTTLIVEGKEHLGHRPSIFLFNHQSNAEMFILATLLRKNITAIVKKELKYSLIGPLFRAADMIFIDRRDRDKAIAAMNPAVEALKNGLSFAIAPEGTRSQGYNLGEFKKVAFHLAIESGVSITPFIMLNSRDLMPRGSFLIKSSTIKIKVHPPIETSHWTKENIEEYILSTRNIFLDALEKG